MYLHLYTVLFILLCCASGGLCINFQNLTQGNYTEENVDISVTSLSHLYVMTKSFVDIAFQPFNALESFIFDIIKDVNDNGGDFLSKLLNQWRTLATFEAGFIACLVAGLLFIIFVPLVALIMCCCRTCCSNCGGEMVQSHKRAKSKWRYCFCTSLLIITVFILVPCIFVFLTNEWVTEVIDIIPRKTNNTLQTINTFIDSVPSQFDQVISQYEVLQTRLTSDVTNIGTSIGNPVRDEFLVSSQTAFNELRQLSLTSNRTLKQLEDANNAVLDIQNGVDDIQTNLSQVQANISTSLNIADCRAIPQCNQTLQDSFKLTLGGNFSSLNSLTDQITNIKNSLNYDIDEEIAKAENQITDIPKLITDNTASQTQDMLNALESVNKTLQDSKNLLPTDALDNIKKEMENLQKTISNVFEVYDPYDIYRYAAGIVLGSIIALVCFCYLLGLLLGCGGFSKDPSSRSCTSNCGGILIMTGVGFSFIFSFLLMILVTVTFTVGGHGERYICQLLETPYEGLAFADRVFDQLGRPIDEQILNNPNANLTISSLFSDCKEGKSLYTAMKLEYVFNISEVAQNATAQIDELNKQVQNFSEPINVTIYTQQVQNAFNSLRGSALSEIDFSQFNTTISEGITATNLTAYAESLNRTADMFSTSSPTLANVLRAQSYELVRIQTEQVDPLQDQLAIVDSSIKNLETTANTLNSTVDRTEGAVIELDQYFMRNGTTVVSRALVNYAQNISNNVFSYTDWLVAQIIHNFAVCRPVYLVYSQVVSLLCDYLIDVLNGLWFCLGWICFFLIPGAIVGMKLAKFYRKMDDPDGNDYNEHWNDMEMDTFNRSNNNGVPASASSKFRSSKIHPTQYY